MPKAAVPTGNVFLTNRWAGDALPQFVWGPICGFAVRLQAPRLGQAAIISNIGVSYSLSHSDSEVCRLLLVLNGREHGGSSKLPPCLTVKDGSHNAEVVLEGRRQQAFAFEQAEAI
jgi:hypothetical protein